MIQFLVDHTKKERMFHTIVRMITHSAVATQDSSSRERLLDAAEHLFANHGFSATSVREITSAAHSHLSAVNYHFGSKEKLIVALLRRAIQPLNEERFRLLDERRRHHGEKPIPLAEALETMLRPCLALSFDPQRAQIFQLLERCMSENGNFIQEIMETEWLPVVNRYMEEFRRTLPHLSEEEIFWRVHFTVGAMVHTAGHAQDLKILSQGRCALDFEPTLKRIIHYACAGIEAAGNYSP
jgi:AcrR family transcriptional regulator